MTRLDSMLAHYAGNYRLQRQRGASGLLEMIAVVAIILTLLVGGLVLFNQVSFSSRVNDAARQMTSLQTEIRSVFQGQANFTGLDNDFVFNAQAYPSDVLFDANADPVEFRHAFDGALSFAEGVPANSFTITMDGVPDAACVRLIQTSASGTGNSGQAGFNILDVEVNEEAAGTAGLVTAADAATACTGGADNEIVFTFGR